MEWVLLGIVALLLVVLIWGSTFVVTKALFGEIGPLGLSFIRFVIASAILVPLADWRNWKALPWPRLVLIGFTGVFLYFLCQNVGLVYTSASAATLILAGIPAITAAVSAVFLRQRIPVWLLVGILTSVFGVSLTALTAVESAASPNPLLGNVLMVGAAIAWSAHTLIGKGIERLPASTVTAAGIVIGSLLLLPFAAYEWGTQGLPTLSVVGWIAVIYLGAGASAAAYFLWNFGLRRLPATTATLYINLIPVVGVALAVATLGEALTMAEIVGGALTVIGVMVASTPWRAGAGAVDDVDSSSERLTEVGG